ncbi:hypothetical protein BKA80DRAFT_271178 [Phyllosticta citrichinensis]
MLPSSIKAHRVPLAGPSFPYKPFFPVSSHFQRKQEKTNQRTQLHGELNSTQLQRQHHLLCSRLETTNFQEKANEELNSTRQQQRQRQRHLPAQLNNNPQDANPPHRPSKCRSPWERHFVSPCSGASCCLLSSCSFWASRPCLCLLGSVWGCCVVRR